MEVVVNMMNGSQIPDEGLPGTFWLEGGPTQPGTLGWSDDGKPMVRTDGVIRESQAIEVTQTLHSIQITPFGGPRESVADTVPMSVLGQLDDGPAVTLRESMLISNGFPPGRQSHLGITLLMGALVPSMAEPFEAVRFCLSRSGLWRGLVQADSLAVSLGEIEGGLSAYVEDGKVWIKMTISSGLPQREWEKRFWYRTCIFLSLWVNGRVLPKRVQLRLPEVDGWIEQTGQRDRGVGSFDVAGTLLDPRGCTLQDVKRALEAFDGWGTVAEIASKDVVAGNSIQTAVFLAASALEGLHHHCYEKRKPFTELSISKAEKIAEVAAKAAVACAPSFGVSLGDEAEATQRILSSFKYFNQLAFEERLADLVPSVEEVAPGLLGEDRQAWIQWVVSARNQEAHRRPKLVASDLMEETDHLYQLAMSAQWALRISVLLQLGVEKKLLRKRLRDHERFLYVLANMDRSENSWPGSRFDSFLAAAQEDSEDGTDEAGEEAAPGVGV